MDEKVVTAPVFVKIDGYKNVINTLDQIKDKLIDARSDLNKITEMKNQEDAKLKEWEASLEKIEHKVEEINDALFEKSTA